MTIFLPISLRSPTMQHARSIAYNTIRYSPVELRLRGYQSRESRIRLRLLDSTNRYSSAYFRLHRINPPIFLAHIFGFPQGVQRP